MTLLHKHSACEEPWPEGILQAPRPWRREYAPSPRLFPSSDWQAFFDECDDMAPLFILSGDSCVGKASVALGSFSEFNDRASDVLTNGAVPDFQLDSGQCAPIVFEEV